MNAALVAEVEQWIALDPDPITAAQLRAWLNEGNESGLRRSFNGFLEFGTAGLRGPVGPGPSCMNRAVVGRAAAGIAAFMKANGLQSVVIGRDGRHGSEAFTEESAEIFSGAGLNVSLLPRPLPTPVLAYAVNHLRADCGVMITASHNPREDNGYKVYLGGTVSGIKFHGSQIISPVDKEISRHISLVNSEQPRGASWTVLDDEVVNSYVNHTAKLGTSKTPIKAVYTAMHGVGKETAGRVFARAGYVPLIQVAEQAESDPDFPTVAFPNPEEPGAMDLALAQARAVDADIVIANDPDADRCAVAINDARAGWRMLRGDELGAIFGEYLAQHRDMTGKAFANSIVSSSLLAKIARAHEIEFHETLTGFKWLSKISNLGYGYEEAIGYAVDPSATNDKDGISAAMEIANITADLKSQGKTLADYLELIWAKYGFHRTEQISIRVTDLGRLSAVMSSIRSNPPTSIAGLAVERCDDLSIASADMPATDGLRFFLEDKVRIIIRPSGTEPKLKCYIEVVRPKSSQVDRDEAERLLSALTPELKKLLS
jgi:phosphomannomutase